MQAARTEGAPRARLARIVLVSLAFLVASSPVIYRDSPEWLPWTSAVVTIGLFFASGWRFKTTPGLVAIVAWVLASTLWTADPAGTATDVSSFVFTVVSGCIIASFDRSIVIRGLFVGACVAAVSSLGIGLFLPRYGRSVEFGGAFIGIYAHRNFLASVAVLGLAFALSYLLSAKTTRSRMMYTLSVALFVATSLATLSGSAIVVSTFVVLGGAILWIYRRISPLLAVGVTPFAAVVIGGIVIPWGIRDLPELTEIIGRDSTLTGRTDIWAIVLEAAAERPLTGFGWGGVWRGPLGDSLRAAFGYDTARSAHNGFIDALIQIGWIGAILLTGLLVAALVRSIRLAITTAELAWMPLALLAVGVNSLTESQLTRPVGVLVIAIVAACSWAESRTRAQERRANKRARYAHMVR